MIPWHRYRVSEAIGAAVMLLVIGAIAVTIMLLPVLLVSLIWESWQ